MTELKPCPNPWCDSVDFEARPTEDSLHLQPDTSRPRFAVHCPYCPQQGPGADTEAEAVAAWNTRPGDEALARKVLEAAAGCQPSTAQDPNEDAYQRGRFDAVMKRILVCALLVAVVACQKPPATVTPAQEAVLNRGGVALVATAPDGTKLWAVQANRIIYFSSAGTQTSHTQSCGKGCARTVDDAVPNAEAKP